MKKTIGTYFSQYFKMPHLYRDDLEAIEKIVRTDLKPKKYILACGGFEYESVSDVPAEISAVNVLVMYTHAPCLRLKFARSWTELYAGDDGTGMDEAVRNIAMIVAKAERPLLWDLCKFSAWLAPLLGFGSLAITLGLIMLGVLTMASLYFTSWLMLMISLWWAMGHRYSLNNFSRIELHESRKQSRVSKPGHDKLRVFLAGAALGGVTAWLLIQFVRWA